MSQMHTFENMCALMRYLEDRDGNRVVFEYMTGMEVHGISGGAFFDQVRRRAAVLERKGFSRAHIGIMGRNRWQWLAGLCAVFQAGGVAVLLSPELSAKEIVAAAAQTDVACVMYDDELYDELRSVEIPLISLDSEPGRDFPTCEYPSAPEDAACILFTSGTTERPKAAVFSHRAVLAGICHNVIGIPFESMLAVLPMHHIAGFASVLNAWYLNRRVCLGTDIKYLYRYLREMKPDYVLTVPSVLQAIMRKLTNSGPNGQGNGWNLRLIGCGGAAFPEQSLARLNAQNIRVLQSYGATEAGGIGFDWEMTPACGKSIGKPCAEMEVKIVDGQLFLRSPSVMTGYYGDPEATAAVLQDGWYATGDLSEQDAEGYLYLRGRIRNLIILSNGENISPEQVERSLMEYELAEEIMVGVMQEQITAWIYPKAGVTVRELERAVDHYNFGVPRSRQIVNLQIMDTPFAKTETGKSIRASIVR